MSILFANQFFNSQFIQALSWTLIHSLWQGLIAAIITGIVIISTKRSSALLRYNLLSALFVCFLISVFATFFIQLSVTNSQIGISNTINHSNASESLNVINASEIEYDAQASFINVFVKYFNANAPLVVLIWFLFFAMQSIKLFAGLHYIHRIRHNKITEPANEWKEQLKLMSNALGIKQQVYFFQSEIVKMPVVIGFLKPTILVPLGLLSNLPPDQVETILLHELAHIRRKDYLINLMQSFAEAVFFFNPAVIWISSLIREEREACCDDIVVANTKNKGSYLEALVSFHESASKTNGYALALSGKKSFLFNRVKRMITYENKKLNIMEKVFLLTGVIVFSAFTFLTNAQKNKAVEKLSVQAQTTAEAKEVIKPVNQIIVDGPAAVTTIIDAVEPEPVLLDTVPKKSKLTNISTNYNDDGETKTYDVKVTAEDGKTYRYKKVNDKITDLYVNDVKVPDAEINNYQAIFEEIDALQAKRKEAAAKRAEDARVRREEMAQRTKENRLRIEQNRKEVENRKPINKNNISSAHAEKRLLHERKMKDHRALMAERTKEVNKKSATTNARRAQEQRAAKMKQGINKRTVELNRAKMANVSNDASPFAIVKDLAKNNVIENTEKVSFTLDNKKLIVNGKKQSSELHQRLKEKYIKNEGDSIDYKKDGNSSRATIINN